MAPKRSHVLVLLLAVGALQSGCVPKSRFDLAVKSGAESERAAEAARAEATDLGAKLEAAQKDNADKSAKLVTYEGQTYQDSRRLAELEKQLVTLGNTNTEVGERLRMASKTLTELANERKTLTTAVNDALYSQFTWAQLEQALADLQDGEGDGVLELYDDYYSRQIDGTYDNSLEAYFAINCLDDPGTKDPQELFDLQDEFAAVAPRLGASWILELQFCAAWPVPAAPPVAIDAAGAGPVVVVGTTGDPATPLISTRHMAEALEDGRLVVVTADQHTGYGLNDCVNEAVDDYLVDLAVPDDELECE